MPAAGDFVVSLHNEKEPSGRRYMNAETISRILHEFKNGWLEAELVNGYRIVISSDKLDRYVNGMEAFQKYLTSIAKTPSQNVAVRSRKKHKPMLIDVPSDFDGLDSSPVPTQRTVTQANERQTAELRKRKVNISESGQSESVEEVASNHSAKNGRNSESKNRRDDSRYRKGSSDDELSSYSDDMPLARRLQRGRQLAYKETPLSGDLSNDEQSESESSTPNGNLRSLGSSAEHLQRNLKRKRASAVNSHLNRSTRSDRSADTSDTHPPIVKRAKGGKKLSEPSSLLSPNVKMVNNKRFPSEDYGSEYSRRHIQYCDTCKMDNTHSFDKGQLIHCQGCSFSYHVLCCKQPGSKHVITPITRNLLVLQCRYCIGTEAADFGSQLCFVCGQGSVNCKRFKSFDQHKSLISSSTSRTPVTSETENDMSEEEKLALASMFKWERVMFRCSRCRRCAHFDHLPPQETKEGDIVSQYSDFLCPVCSEYTSKVENILAWRPIGKQAEESSEGVSLETVPGYKREYLVKFEHQSYFRVTWVVGGWLLSTASSAQLRSFHRKHAYPVYSVADAVPEDNYRIEFVLDVTYKGNKTRSEMQFKSEEEELNSIGEVREVFAKSKGLSFSELFWEEAPSDSHTERYTDFREAYEDYVKGFYIHLPQSDSTGIQNFRKSSFSRHELKEQPKFIRNGTLMDYQLDGMNWLYFKWFQRKPAILADDMGLGKTIQVISYLSILFHVHGVWPLLVVAPQSTVPNWKREFRRWAPDLRCIAYNGWKEHRQIQQKYQLCVTSRKNLNDLNCHVVITSFNALMDDSTFLNKFQWKSLVVDEGQRLKSDKNMTYRVLSEIHTEHKVLLTGTPLQNNIRELFNLLQFLNPMEVDAEKLEEKYSEMNESNVVELHRLLQPYFLRRTKGEVLSHLLPEKTEIIVPISMVNLQKHVYKSILAKNPDLLRAIVSKANISTKGSASSLNNIFMQLRKCLCHPYLCSEDIEQLSSDPKESHRRLIEACGKLQLLSVMLPKLIGSGHRILIFSQFVRMLDILEDFLDGLDISYTRLDGSLTSQDRQQRIDAFNAENSTISVFLLSTRAGGIGINLATADTVIVYDPDFNPHQDMQALSRAYRIGQKSRVLVFNLVTRNSVEEKILEIGRRKMVLDHIVIENMGSAEEEHLDVQAILRNGARALFENEEDNIRYDSATIDKLLERTEEDKVSTSQQKEENPFGFARVWENEAHYLAEFKDTSDSEKKPEEDDTGFWDKILQKRETEIEEELAAREAQLGRGKRIRDAVYKDVVDRAQPDATVQEVDNSDRQAGPRTTNSSDSEASYHLPANQVEDETEDEFHDVDMDEIELVTSKSAGSPVTKSSLLRTSSILRPGTANTSKSTPFGVRKPEIEMTTLPPPNPSQTTAGSESAFAPSVPLVPARQISSTNQTPAISVDPAAGTSTSPLLRSAVASAPETAKLPTAAAALPKSDGTENIAVTDMTDTTGPAVQSLRDGPNQVTSFPSRKTSPRATPVNGDKSQSAYHDTLELVQLPANNQMQNNSRHRLICNGLHLTHQPGKCPIRTAPVEFCPLCGYAHLSGIQICPQFLSVKQLDFLMNAVKESKEPEQFRALALKYLGFLREKLTGSATSPSDV
ncbi:P-loop containing nucleoside triphosphate hydrolase protein [Lipomyces kononenkoae]|uniref:P-loop containing nucleoside triphosphate hydrolase protein n=1 Tax=Lipomyces kononenkoae TaxID=34357 RepID=A0ACC3T5R7_LIPKO